MFVHTDKHNINSPSRSSLHTETTIRLGLVTPKYADYSHTAIVLGIRSYCLPVKFTQT